MAVSRLQGELAKEGREPSLAKGTREGAFSGKAAGLRSSRGTRGRKLIFDLLFSFLIARRVRNEL